MKASVPFLCLALGCSMAGDAARGTAGEPDGASSDAGQPPLDDDLGGGLYAGSESGTDTPDPGATPSEGGGEARSCLGETTEPAFVECTEELLAVCPGVRSCCVADARCCSPVVGGQIPEGTLTFDCAAGDAVACLASKGWTAVGFGDPQPAVRDGALLPNGDASYDSGVLLGETVDLTAHTLAATATFVAPTACDGACLEAVGVGFTAAVELHDNAHVEVLAGLLYSGARREVSLLRGGVAVESWAMAADEETWSLHLSPDGVEVWRGATRETLTDAAGAPSGRLVVWGRNENRPADAPLGARLRNLTVTTSLCDAPSVWPERAEVSILDVRDRSWTPGTVRAPGFASDDAGNVLVALEERGNILIGRLAAGTTQVELLGSQDVSAVDDGKTLADPALLWHPTRGWLLYYTILDGETASIGRAVSGTGETFTPDAEPVLRATAATPRFEQPTVATHLSDQLVMIVRTTDDDGVTQLAAYRSLGGVSWTHVETSHLEALTRRGDVSHDGFTADDVAHPSLVVHNGAWQVYYAGRRGTRWSIGLLASDELLHWRDVGLVLSGDGNGFDRLGASAPAARSVADRVELLFEGHDGVYTSIGFAARPSTSSGARL